MTSEALKKLDKITFPGVLIALGIVFGDLGTSPLYVLRAITGHTPIDSNMTLGAVSCIFWTLTFQTSIKYIYLTLKADNKGEGGIFSLYALVKRTKVKWLILPAIIGGSMLLADGIITPAITISSSVEGLKAIYPDFQTVPVVLIILCGLFFFQQFGTVIVGESFGPIMVIWFTMLAIIGGIHLPGNLWVFKAVNPYYAYNLLVHYPGGFWLLGAIFLCTTGAEALYSDIGHCGRNNIRVSWLFVKITLLINYFGQTAWLINHSGETLNGTNPFFRVVPDWFLIPSIIIATIASIIASQAIISGAYTLISEAIHLNFWPKMKISYPTNQRGQLYIPTVNWILFLGCCGVVLYLQDSSKMEAAYGLAIIFTMLMTTILLSYYMVLKRYNIIFIILILSTFVFIEASFLIANLKKFTNGGWITLFIATLLSTIMYFWYHGRKIRNKYLQFIYVEKYLKILSEISKDKSIPKFATHLVYVIKADRINEIEAKVFYSIIEKHPKRADLYWFLHVDVHDEPHMRDYKVTELIHKTAYRIDFKLGFRVIPRLNIMFRKVLNDMVANKEIDIKSRYDSLSKTEVTGDFRFVFIEETLSHDNDLSIYEKIVLDAYFYLRHISLPDVKAYGLDSSLITFEQYPLMISPARDVNLKRIH
ncbi:MAG: KUP/HAK/KT family potassium transporter [Bacteroidales bacterium]|jgi:KUP system potassium uptake protein